MAERKRVTKSSSNVFSDLGYKDADAMLAKAALAARIAKVIQGRKLTQVQAAKLLQIDQPKVSALLRGNLRGFSTDRLFRYLNALGSDVEITIVPRPRSSREPQVRVIESARKVS
jgi:predicted XRE-type DNA-binding protein